MAKLFISGSLFDFFAARLCVSVYTCLPIKQGTCVSHVCRDCKVKRGHFQGRHLDLL